MLNFGAHGEICGYPSRNICIAGNTRKDDSKRQIWLIKWREMEKHNTGNAIDECAKCKKERQDVCRGQTQLNAAGCSLDVDLLMEAMSRFADENRLERTTKLGVENRVDNRVHE